MMKDASREGAAVLHMRNKHQLVPALPCGEMGRGQDRAAVGHMRGAVDIKLSVPLVQSCLCGLADMEVHGFRQVLSCPQPKIVGFPWQSSILFLTGPDPI